MKKLLFVGLLLLAPIVEAQETYSLSATAAQVTDLQAIVQASNEKVCNRFALADSCTQAQACTAAGAPGGASCTAAQARSVNVRVFPNTQAGREEFVTFVVAAPRFQDLRAGILGHNREKFCAFWATATRGQKDGICTAAGRAAGCELCP